MHTQNIKADTKFSIYSRQNPSPEYKRLVKLYQELHRDGNKVKKGKDFYPGKSLWPHIGFIKALIDKYNAQTILDYGAGKGRQYTDLRVKLAKGKMFPSIEKFWNVHVHSYDAGHEPFREWPEGTFDGTISTDVLEHCPKDDIDWIVGEIFEKAEKFVFANIACYPAIATLPNGENAHVTVEPPEWWAQRIEAVAKNYPDIDYYFLATVHKKTDETLITNKQRPSNIPQVGALPKNIFKAYVALLKQKLKKR